MYISYITWMVMGVTSGNSVINSILFTVIRARKLQSKSRSLQTVGSHILTTMWCNYHTMMSQYTGALYISKLSQFHAVFWKFWKVNALAWKSWIYPYIVNLRNLAYLIIEIWKWYSTFVNKCKRHLLKDFNVVKRCSNHHIID